MLPTLHWTVALKSLSLWGKVDISLIVQHEHVCKVLSKALFVLAGFSSWKARSSTKQGSEKFAFGLMKKGFWGNELKVETPKTSVSDTMLPTLHWTVAPKSLSLWGKVDISFIVQHEHVCKVLSKALFVLASFSSWKARSSTKQGSEKFAFGLMKTGFWGNELKVETQSCFSGFWCAEKQYIYIYLLKKSTSKFHQSTFSKAPAQTNRA
jgi:hypothetical protein